MCLTAIDSPYTHKEPVLDLKWLYDQGMKKHLLSSIGADGKVCLSNKIIMGREI